jgi:hypothetical protein
LKSNGTITPPRSKIMVLIIVKPPGAVESAIPLTLVLIVGPQP